MSLSLLSVRPPLCRIFLPDFFIRKTPLKRTVVSCSSTLPQETATENSSSNGSDFRNFKPPPIAGPPRPHDLAKDLPFQYWYSYADLAPGVPKRRPKSNPALVADAMKRWDPLTLEILAAADSDEEKEEGIQEVKHFPKRRQTPHPSSVADASPENTRWVSSNTFKDPKQGLQREEYISKTKILSSPGVYAMSKRGLSTLDKVSDDRGEVVLTFPKEEKLETAGEEEDQLLSGQEVMDLVATCHESSRQINIGWKGWSPNYVGMVHSYWKKAPVCKIKCKGLPTLEMDVICNTLEENVGGKVIYRAGGTVYFFRGSNYKYWRDVSRTRVRRKPLPKRVAKRLPIPDILTKEDVLKLRARGRDLPALCKPAENGVYLTLLNDVRTAFQRQDLVRINCQTFHAKNLKALGAKLKALVPCELISYEFEHILMWRRNDENTSDGG